MCSSDLIMGLQPWKLNKELKVRMAAAGIKNPHRVDSSFRGEGRGEAPSGGDKEPLKANPFREFRLFPVGKLGHRLGLSKYIGRKAPLREEFPLPVTRVVLKLKQHIGAPAEPVVLQGDAVERGQMVARGGGPVSAHVHSPLSGVVRAVEKDRLVVEVRAPREGE